MSAFKGWRTFAFNGLVILATVAAALDMNPLVKQLLPPEYAWVLLAIAVVNVILRGITTTPPGRH